MSYALPPHRPWAEVRPRFVDEIVSEPEPFKVFAVGEEVLRARRDGQQLRLARLEKGAFVDEDAWSRGLPVHPCSHVDAVFGRFPDRLWLIENWGGSMRCSALFGDHIVWKRANGAWVKDIAHSPPVDGSTMTGGILAAWPLAPGVLGVGLSNLVGDTLSHPVEAMWTLAPDPWATRVSLTKDAPIVETACASASGGVAAFSYREGRFTLVRIPAQRETPVPTPLAPEGPCAMRAERLVVVQHASTPDAREIWLSFDGSAWTSTAAPWPYVTTRIEFLGAQLVALATDSDQRTHALVGSLDLTSWSELTGLPGRELSIVSTGPNELLLHIDHTRLVRVGL